MKTILELTTFAVLLASLQAAKLPDNFQLCHKNDPNLEECLRNAVQNAIHDVKDGIPNLQLLPTDPLLVTKISIQQGEGRPVSIKLDLNNAIVKGFSESKIISSISDLNKRVIEATITLKDATLDSDYVMDGKFLVLPLKGNGKCTLKFHDLLGKLKLQAEPKTKNGKVYWHVTRFDAKVTSLGKFEMNFENLFNGDKALGDNTNKVLNENWKEFWEELKPSFEETFSAVFEQLANVVFEKVPEKDIFLD